MTHRVRAQAPASTPASTPASASAAAPTGARPASTPRHLRTGRADDRGWYLLFLIPSGVLFLAVIVVPFVMNIGISFTRWPGVGPMEWIGTGNYRRLFADERFWSSFRNNLALIVAMAVIPTIIGLILASALFDFVGNRFGPRVASALRAAFYLPQVLPFVVAGIVWGWILRPDDGAANAFLTAIGLGSLAQDWLGDPDLALITVMGVLIWVQVGFPVVIFMAGLQRVDPELYEAAEIDGASWWRRARHITVPQIRPEIYVVLVVTTIAALKSFDKIYILTRGGPGDATNVPAYFSYQNFFEKTTVGYGAAIATVLTAIILVLTAVFLRLQSRGEGEGR